MRINCMGLLNCKSTLELRTRRRKTKVTKLVRHRYIGFCERPTTFYARSFSLSISVNSSTPTTALATAAINSRDHTQCRSSPTRRRAIVK